MSIKKILNTIGTLIAGAYAGEFIKGVPVVASINIIGVIGLACMFITGDWKTSLEEKHIQKTRNDADLEILEQELSKAKIRKAIRDLDGKGFWSWK
jgi:hypothetical protein